MRAILVPDIKGSSCALGILTCILMMTGCVGGAGSEKSVDAFISADREYAQSQVDWLSADLALLKDACSQLKTIDKKPLQATYVHWQQIVARNPVDDNIDNQARARAPLDEIDKRVSECASLGEADNVVSRASSEADSADGTAALDDINKQLQVLRAQLSAEIDAFPTNVLPQSNFRQQAIASFHRDHSTALTKAGDAVASAVDSARDASGNAVLSTAVSTHEADKDLAKKSDEQYTVARTSLNEIGEAQTPDATFSAIDVAFSNAQMAIAYASDATSGKSANPVNDVDEAVPHASYQPMDATPAPQETSDSVAAGTSFSPSPAQDNAVSVNEDAPNGADLTTPASAVQSFYNNISARNYQDAYGLLAADYRAHTTLAQFVQGYATTQSVQPTVGQFDGVKMLLPVTLVAVDLKSSGQVTTVFKGYWRLIRVGKDWKLLDGKFSH